MRQTRSSGPPTGGPMMYSARQGTKAEYRVVVREDPRYDVSPVAQQNLLTTVYDITESYPMYTISVGADTTVTKEDLTFQVRDLLMKTINRNEPNPAEMEFTDFSDESLFKMDKKSLSVLKNVLVKNAVYNLKINVSNEDVTRLTQEREHLYIENQRLMQEMAEFRLLPETLRELQIELDRCRQSIAEMSREQQTRSPHSDNNAPEGECNQEQSQSFSIIVSSLDRYKPVLERLTYVLRGLPNAVKNTSGLSQALMSAVDTITFLNHQLETRQQGQYRCSPQELAKVQRVLEMIESKLMSQLENFEEDLVNGFSRFYFRLRKEAVGNTFTRVLIERDATTLNYVVDNACNEATKNKVNDSNTKLMQLAMGGNMRDLSMQDNNEIGTTFARLSQKAVENKANFILTFYGQSGSGKTYTAIGSRTKGTPHAGTIQIAIDNFLQKGYNVKATVIQFYMNKWYYGIDAGFKEINRQGDVVVPKFYAKQLAPGKFDFNSKFEGLKNYEINIQTIDLAALEKFDIQGPNDLEQLIRRSEELRPVRAMPQNLESSRSHMFYIFQINDSILVFADLAGSELQSNSRTGGASTVATSEGLSITAALLCLGTIYKQYAVLGRFEQNETITSNCQDGRFYKLFQQLLSDPEVLTKFYMIFTSKRVAPYRAGAENDEYNSACQTLKQTIDFMYSLDKFMLTKKIQR